MIEFIDREISTTVLEAAKYFSVICITGPRQSGKSTLIRHLFGSYKRVSLENPDVRMSAEADPVAFLNQTSGGLVIDEAQRLPILLEYIQTIVDEHPERRFILSGSSNFLLLKKVSESLAGRAGIFELLPMSLSEVKHVYANLSLDEMLYNGMYPAVCSGKNVAKYLYPAYLKTYLDRDVRELVNVNNMTKFHTFLRLCAGRIGSVFNASEISNELGVSSNTVASWLSVLEASYVIVRLQPWSENTRKRLTKSPKIYFCDTGLACYLLDIESPEQLSHDRMRGHLFENLIVMEALKKRFNHGRESNIYYYRDAKGNEIDLLVLNSGSMDAYEIKSSMTYSTEFERALRKMASWITTPINSRAVVYAGEYENSAAEIKIKNYRSYVNSL